MKDYGLVSIGSHTGFWLTKEIEKFSNTKILLVEPVKYNLDELKKLIKSYKNIEIEESAISNKDEKVPFYYIKKSSIDKLKKHWASGIGSFDKNHILNHRSKRFLVDEKDIESTNINCLSFDSLIKKYSINSIEKLMLDVEGAEYKILKSIDFRSVKIKEIFFEKKHFDGSFSEGKKYEEIKAILIKEGYDLIEVDKENISAKKSF